FFSIQPIGLELAVSHDKPVSGNVDHLVSGCEIIRLIPSRHPCAHRARSATGPKAFATSFRPAWTHPVESSIVSVAVIGILHENIGFPPTSESILGYHPELVLVASAHRFPAVDFTGIEVQVLAAV